MNTSSLQQLTKNFTGFCPELNCEHIISVIFFKQFQNHSKDYIISRQTFICHNEDKCRYLKENNNCPIFENAEF